MIRTHLRRLREWWAGSRGTATRGWLGVGGGDRHQRGWRAESHVAARLERDGYHILGRNVRVGPGEVDIIAEEAGVLVFVEVRSREEGALLSPVETLTREKRRRMMRCGDAYIRDRRLGEVPHRYDVAEVYLDGAGKPSRIEILRDALHGPQ